MSENWVDIGALDDIPFRGARQVRTPAGTIAVFRAADGAVFALADQCPHRKGPLSQGIVHGRQVTCPLHNLVVDLETGGAADSDGGCAKTYPTALRDGRVLVDLTALKRNGARVA